MLVRTRYAHHTSHGLSARALGLTLKQSTTPSGTRLKLKLKFPTVTKSSLMNLYLRWPNTVFARALSDAIQRAQKDCKNKHAVDKRSFYLLNARSIFAIFFVIERSALMALVFYNKGMLEKVTIQRTQQFSDFSKSKEPS